MGQTKNLYFATVRNSQYMEDVRIWGDGAVPLQYVEIWADSPEDAASALTTNRWVCEGVIEVDHLGDEIEPEAEYRREPFGKIKIGP